MNTKVYMSAELHTTEQFPGGHCAGMRGRYKGKSKCADCPFLLQNVLQHRRMYNSTYVEFKNR